MVYRRLRNKFNRIRRYNKFRTQLTKFNLQGNNYNVLSRRLANKGVHYFKRTVVRKLDVNPAVIGQTSFYANDWLGGNGDFQLNYTPQVGELTNLFDLYKINGVRMKFIYDRADATPAPSSLPTLYLIRDVDDGTPPGFLTDMQQYESLKMKRLDKPCSFFVKPKISQMVYKSAITTAYSTPRRNPWLDCNNADVPHYGFKWALDCNSAFASSIGTLTVMITYYIACKDVR